MRALTVIVALFVFVSPASAFAQSTTRFEGRLPCSSDGSALKHSTFTTPLGRVRLVDGKACIKLINDSPNCEWNVSLIRADQWGASSELLVAAVEIIHSTPGAQLSVFVFACRGGWYEPVFAETFGDRGASLVLGPESSFDIITGDWLPADAGCCPSRERRTTFRWNAARRTFVQIRSTVTVRRPAPPPPDRPASVLR